MRGRSLSFIPKLLQLCKVLPWQAGTDGPKVGPILDLHRISWYTLSLAPWRTGRMVGVIPYPWSSACILTARFVRRWLDIWPDLERKVPFAMQVYPPVSQIERTPLEGSSRTMPLVDWSIDLDAQAAKIAFLRR